MATKEPSPEQLETAPPPDILHPSTSLEWQEWPPLPVEMTFAKSVWLDGTLFVGGSANGTDRDDARLYAFQPGVDTEWSHIDTPIRRFALVAYKSQLLLVGGKDYLSGENINKIFTLRDGDFVETLPPMREKRSATSAVSTGSVLIVAGGLGDSGVLSSVEFLEDGQWKTAPSLPGGGHDMSSALDGDQWCLINNKSVYSVSLSFLISGSDQPWKELPDAPNADSAAAFFGDHLLSIGGPWGNPTTAINAFSTASQSWEHVADLPISLYYSSAIVLPTGELVVAGGKTKKSRSSYYSNKVFRAFIKRTALMPHPEEGASPRAPHNPQPCSASHYHLHLPAGVSGTSEPGPGPPRAITMSIDQLVDYVGISTELLDRQVSVQYLRQIAVYLPIENWQLCVEHLGFHVDDVSDIQALPMPDRYKAFQLLERWLREFVFNAKYSRLVELCLSQGHGTAAEKICCLVKESIPLTVSGVKRGPSEQEQDEDPVKHGTAAEKICDLVKGRESRPDLQALFEITLPAQNEWFFLGLALGVNSDDLTAIKAKNNSYPIVCLLYNMLVKVSQIHPNYTWRTVHDALRVDTVNRHDVAQEIMSKYLMDRKSTESSSTVRAVKRGPSEQEQASTKLHKSDQPPTPVNFS